MMIEKGCLQKQKLGPIKKNFSNLLRPDTFKLGHLPTSFCLYLSFRYLAVVGSRSNKLTKREEIRYHKVDLCFKVATFPDGIPIQILILQLLISSQ